MAAAENSLGNTQEQADGLNPAEKTVSEFVEIREDSELFTTRDFMIALGDQYHGENYYSPPDIVAAVHPELDNNDTSRAEAVNRFEANVIPYLVEEGYIEKEASTTEYQINEDKTIEIEVDLYRMSELEEKPELEEVHSCLESA